MARGICNVFHNLDNTNTAILFKTIFNIIHTNFLIFASYLITNNQMNINKFNQKHLENLISIIDQDLKVKLNKREIL